MDNAEQTGTDRTYNPNEDNRTLEEIRFEKDVIAVVLENIQKRGRIYAALKGIV